MPNINSVNPADISTTPPASSGNNIFNVDQSDIQTPEQFNEEKFTTPGQQALTVGENLGQGFAGPVATGIEAGLTKIGVPGLSPEEQAARSKYNPGEAIGSQLVGFGVGAFTGTGEAALLAKIGTKAVQAARLAEASNLASKVAAAGIRGGAELAALQTGDEVSKFINEDPGQTLGTAAINIGLSGIIGGAGGAALGAVSPLWNNALNKIGVSKIASDFMGETKFLQENPEMVSGAKSELESRMNEVQEMRNVLSQSKPELIDKAMPEPTMENLKKIDSQINGIDEKITSELNSAGTSVKTKAAVPYLNEDFLEWQKVVTSAEATNTQKYLATNKLKQNFADYAKWGLTEEGSAKADLGRRLSNYIRPLLEDEKVWGGAAEIQKVTNAATTNVIRATEDLLSKVTSKEMGARAVDPDKLQTFFNQAEKGKGLKKANAIRNYLDYTQEQADAINKAHLDNGLEAPLGSQLNPTPILDHSLNTPLTSGRSLAQWAYRKGAGSLAHAAGQSAGGVFGGAIGASIGHPLAGAWAGEKILGPTLSVLAKPFAENAINSEAMRSSVDYMAGAAKSESTMTNAVKNVFRTGEVIPKHLLPDEDSRKKLEKSLSHIEDPNNMFGVGGNIGHYLPAHATAAGTIAASAKNYFDNLRPKQSANAPFDTESPPDAAQQNKYNRALDVAQQPLLVLKYAKEGKLLPQDVETLQNIYPGFHSGLVKKINNEIIEHKSRGETIPYSQRVSLAMLMGSPLDSTMKPSSMQAILASSGLQQQQQAPNAQVKVKKASGNELKQINKVNDLYATRQQSREIQRRT